MIKSVSGEDYATKVQEVKESVMGKDFDFPRLEHHLSVLKDIIRQALPEVKNVTSIRTVCTAVTSSNYRSTFTKVHKLLRLYMTVPITFATSDRAFSTLRRLFTCLLNVRKRRNNCALLHIHKDLVDSMHLVAIAKSFCLFNDERIRYFGSFKE